MHLSRFWSRAVSSSLAILALIGCNMASDDPGVDSSPSFDSRADLNAAITIEMENTFPDRPAGVEGMGLIVYDADDQPVFQHTVGNFDFDQRLAVASASKLVSGLVLMRLVDQGVIGLGSTTADVLGWANENGQIKLEELGAFVSGLFGSPGCTRSARTTLESCVDDIGALDTVAQPGEAMNYGNSHLHVAGRMAEVATSQSWQAVADAELFGPLGIASDALRYYTIPKESRGLENPLIAGGLRATTNEYAKILGVAVNGRDRRATLIGEDLIGRLRENPNTTAAVFQSPYANQGYDYRYGFASWLECEDTPATCPVFSSAGSYGFTPWVDDTHGYYAILAMESDEPLEGAIFAVDLQHRLKPLIAAALGITRSD